MPPLTAINKVDLSHDIDRDISMSTGEQAALNANVQRFSCVGIPLDIDRKQPALIPNYCRRNRARSAKLDRAFELTFRRFIMRDGSLEILLCRIRDA